MSATFTVHSPYDASVLETLNYNTAADIESFLEKAQKLHRRGPLPIYQRAEILKKTAELVAVQSKKFALTIAQEGGKPLMDAQVEVDRAVQGIYNAIEVMHSASGKEIPMGLTPGSSQRLAFTTKEPIGVVVAVSAFNHPLNLIVHQVIPAIATGCPVIVKPALTTPLSCQNLVALLEEAGLPDGWCQAALVNDELATKLVSDTRVAFFSFIGSAKVGWWLRSQLAPGARCALEHGGVAPVIIEKDAKIERLIPAMVKGGFYHAGQVCVSTQRLYVHKDIVDNVTEALSESIQKLKVGDPTKMDTEVGPLILPREVERVDAWVNEAIEEGAKRIIGSGPISDTCYSPTFLRDPSSISKVTCSEVFGPVITVNTYEDAQDALALANGLPVSFQAAIFTQDIDNALGLAKRINASAVMINDHTAFRVDWMPFAGRKTSGLGIGGIPHTMHDMTEEKLIVFNSPQL